MEIEPPVSTPGDLDYFHLSISSLPYGPSVVSSTTAIIQLQREKESLRSILQASLVISPNQESGKYQMIFSQSHCSFYRIGNEVKYQERVFRSMHQNIE